MALSYALVDSPIGMLAWIRDKMEPLVDNKQFKWDDGDVITWAMVCLCFSLLPTLNLWTVDVYYTWHIWSRKHLQEHKRKEA